MSDAPNPIVSVIRPLLKPGRSWRLIRHLRSRGDVEAIRSLLPSGVDVSSADLEGFFAEVLESRAVLDAMESQRARKWTRSSDNASPREVLRRQVDLDGPGRSRVLFLYVLARLLRPEIVIETGCFSGWDTTLLLLAMEKNQRGHLWTIDLPAREGEFSQEGATSSLPDGWPIGFLVPVVLKERWSLIEGDARMELPGLIKEIETVDVFFHDSDHSYSHMMWEFTTIWPRLPSGGVIVSDDVSWNNSFWQFARSTDSPFVIHRSAPNVGALRKR